MSRRQLLVNGFLLLAPALFADDQALWREYGLVETQHVKQGPRAISAYQMKDPTGALAAWQWQRSPEDRPCTLTAFCAQNNKRTLLSDGNYFLMVQGPPLNQEQLESFAKALPNFRDSALPAILTFVPRQGLVPNSSRYVVGPESLRAFAPELSATKPGFADGAEAQIAEYGGQARLAIFNYATPEMARLHSAEFNKLPGIHLKRSGVLVAMVFGGANDAQADSLLSRIEYEARITWNDVPPPSPIKPLYRLLLNIAYMSIALVALCSVAGLFYAGMRLYRRRYGTLESDEAMTTLNLSGD